MAPRMTLNRGNSIMQVRYASWDEALRLLAPKRRPRRTRVVKMPVIHAGQ